MVFSINQDEQRILSEIRECLLQDPRFARLGGHPHEDGALDRLGEYHVAAGIVPEPSTERIKRQAIAQGGGITGDNPSTAPNALTIDQNAPPAGLQNEEIPSDSPSIAPVAPLIDPNHPRQPTAQIAEVSNDGPSVAKRLFRTGAYGFIITVIVGTAFVWQSSDETTKEMAKGWVNSLVWSSSLHPHNLPPESDVASEAGSTTSNQPLMESIILPTTSASQRTPTSTATESLSFPDLKKQLEFDSERSLHYAADR